MSEEAVVRPRKAAKLTNKELLLLATVLSNINHNLVVRLTEPEDRVLLRMQHLLFDRLNARRPVEHRYSDAPIVPIHPDQQDPEGAPAV